MIGLAVVAAGYFVFSGAGDSGPPPAGPATEASSEPAGSVPVPDAPIDPAGSAAEPAAAAGPGAVAVPERGPRTAEDYYEAGEAPPVEEIPPGILEEFRRGTAPISDERRELMARGREEMPDRIREDFESAATRRIPSDVLADFENPFPDPPADVEEDFPGGVIPGRMNAPPPSDATERGTP